MSSLFNRDDFKPSTVASLKEEDDKVDRILGKNQGFSDFLTLLPGKNYLRIFPAHPSNDPSPRLFAEPRVVTSLPILQEERDERNQVIVENGVVKKVEKNKNIFNSKIHGNLSFDLVEEYIDRVKAKAEKLYPGNSNPKGKSEYLKYIYGVFIKKGSPNNLFGITYQSKWVMYVKRFNPSTPDIQPEFGRLEIGKAIKNRLNEMAAIEAASQAISVDPYTHPDSGVAIVIDYNSEAKQASDFYKTELYLPRDGREITLFPLRDEDLNWLLEQESLYSQFRNTFTRRDLNFQIEGLERIDKKTGYGIFNDESFLNKIEEAIKLVPDLKKEETTTVVTQETSPVEVQQTVTPVTTTVTTPKVEEPVVTTPAPVVVQESPVVVEEVVAISAEDRLAAMRRKMLGGS